MDDRGIVIEVEFMVCIQNLGGRQILRFMREGILVWVMGVVVVVVGMLFFGECSQMETFNYFYRVNVTAITLMT